MFATGPCPLALNPASDPVRSMSLVECRMKVPPTIVTKPQNCAAISVGV